MIKSQLKKKTVGFREQQDLLKLVVGYEGGKKGQKLLLELLFLDKVLQEWNCYLMSSKDEY